MKLERPGQLAWHSQTPAFYDNLARALPVLAVVVDAAQVEHFNDEKWCFHFDADADVLSFQVIPDSQANSSPMDSISTPDGEVVLRLRGQHELEIADLVENRMWITQLPDLRINPEAKVRLTINRAGTQLFIHASDSRYLNRSQGCATLFVFDINRTPRRRSAELGKSRPGKMSKLKPVQKLFDKILDKYI